MTDRTNEEIARKLVLSFRSLSLIDQQIEAVATALASTRASALEEAARVADGVGDDPPGFDRPEHWQSGFQDGAMEAAAAIRDLINAPQTKEQDRSARHDR